MWLRGIISEIKLMLKGQRFVWYLIGVAGIGSTVFFEADIAQMYVLPLLMLWFINVFSNMGSREHQNNVLSIITTIPNGRIRQITYSWAAGIIIAFALALPVIVKMSVIGQYSDMLSVLAGVIFLPSFALFLGEMSKTGRVFELLFIAMTYFSLNGLPIIMYLGNPQATSLTSALTYLVVGIACAAAAIVKREKLA
jgi:hypothetical protein